MYNFMMLFVLYVACIDQFCLINYVSYELELNPLGKLLIYLGGVSLFAVAKAGGTAFVAWALTKGQYTFWGPPVVYTIAFLQFVLLCVLFS
jgi:hypothetical protein